MILHSYMKLLTNYPESTTQYNNNSSSRIQLMFEKPDHTVSINKFPINYILRFQVILHIKYNIKV